MRKLILFVTVLAIILCIQIIASEKVLAETSNEFPEIGSISFGCGPHWGGVLGFNYVGLGEGSDLGFSLGAGWGADEVGINGGIVYRLLAEQGLFLTYGTAGIEELNWGDYTLEEGIVNGFNIMYGNTPNDSMDFVWRIGVSFPKGYDPMFDLGIGISF